MKKTILTTTLALGLGFTGIAADQEAEASEQNVNQQELAEMAQNNSSELDNSAIHAGEYSYNFSIDGVSYNFESDGTYYSWSYTGSGNAEPQEEVNQQEQTQNNNNEQAEEQQQQQQEQAQQQQQNQQQEQAEEQQQQQNQQQEQQQSQGDAQTAAPTSSGGQDWGALAQCESGGDPGAVNPSGAYHGLYQFDQQTWESVGGTGSPSDASAQEQTQRAEQLHADRGAQPWPVCGANL